MERNHLLTAGLIAVGLILAAVLLTAPSATAQSTADGRFRVVANDKAFVLYDVNDSSKSWVLTIPSNYKRLAWKPIKRLDSDAEVQNWDLVEGARN